MYVQTENEIVFTSDTWRAIAKGVAYLLLGAVPLGPVVLSFYFDGMRTFNSPIDSLLLLTVLTGIGAPIAGLGLWLTFMLTLNPDRVSISAKGITNSHFGLTRTFPWSCLGDLTYLPGGKGSSGSYLIRVASDDKSIRIAPDMFGVSCEEVSAAIRGARAGKLPSIDEIHERVERQERQLAMVFVPLGGFFIAVMMLVAIFARKTS